MVNKIIYTTKIELNKLIVDKLKNYIDKYPKGKTLNNFIEDLKLSRGTCKTYLTAMACNGDVLEVCYNKNTKVFFPKNSILK